MLLFRTMFRFWDHSFMFYIKCNHFREIGPYKACEYLITINRTYANPTKHSNTNHHSKQFNIYISICISKIVQLGIDFYSAYRILWYRIVCNNAHIFLKTFILLLLVNSGTVKELFVNRIKSKRADPLNIRHSMRFVYISY